MSLFHNSKSFFDRPEFEIFLSVVRRGKFSSSRGIDREIIGDEHESDSETRKDSASESGANIESSLS